MIALHELLSAPHADNTPVCRDGASMLDAASFRSHVLNAAAVLRSQTAQRVALCIDDPFHFACVLFALFACGKTPVVPANSTQGYLADLAGAYDALLTDADVPTLIAHASSARPAAATHIAIDPHAPLVLFTSGSSGTPKPVHKTLAQFDAEVRTLERQWGALAGTATMLASVPHHHIYGLLFRVLWPLAAGRAFDRTLITDPSQLQARLAQVGTAIVVSTPAQLSRWPSLEGFASLRFASLAPAPLAFFSSGGPLDPRTASDYASTFGAAPIEIYGSTETGGIAWRRQSDTDAWQPVVGVDVRRDEDGALAVRSPHLDHDGWHRTEDAIVFDDDGRFRLQGRLDRVIKLDGKRVSLPELEALLARHPHVAQAAIARLAGATRERIGALVALTPQGRDALRANGRVALAKALRRHLAAYVDVVALPRYWRFRDALPFDARGKLPAAAVAAAFDVSTEGFELLAETRIDDALHFELRVPPTLVHFAGHFPGLAILPGVVQIDWAIRLASTHIAGVRAVASIDRLKFLAPVPPGAVLQLTLEHDAAQRRVRFGYRLGERDCASGVIVYREDA